MTAGTELVHVTWGTSRAESVRDALKLQSCRARVIGLTHDLSLGPIDPIDPVARKAWFAAKTRSDDEARDCGSDPEVPWMDATAAGLHPVYWVCLTDAGEHASLLAFASRMIGRPFDIVDATGLDLTDVGGPVPLYSLGQIRPKEIVTSGLDRRRRPFTRTESDAAAAAWARLRAENAPLRVVRDCRLVSAPLTHFDAVLTQYAACQQESIAKLIGRVLHHLSVELNPPGRGCSYELLFARILALGDFGTLEVTGSGPGMRDYAVRLPVVSPSA